MSSVEKTWGKKVAFIYFNYLDEKDKAYAAKLGLTTKTTLQFYDKNGKMVNQITGVQTREYIINELRKITK